ncbi:MAG: hypothetical protein Q8M37_02290 [Nevskia sp.]|nr:hypothetical protein [Nevskia sp.]
MQLPNYDHVAPKTVRFWALFDTGVMSLALPFTSPLFINFLYWLNGLIGGTPTPPTFDPFAMFFVNMSGVLVLVWVAARLIRPLGVFALVDAIGRCAISLLIAYYILFENVIPVLWLFVLTEMLGAVMQFRAVWRRDTGM